MNFIVNRSCSQLAVVNTVGPCCLLVNLPGFGTPALDPLSTVHVNLSVHSDASALKAASHPVGRGTAHSGLRFFSETKTMIRKPRNRDSETKEP